MNSPGTASRSPHTPNAYQVSDGIDITAPVTLRSEFNHYAWKKSQSTASEPHGQMIHWADIHMNHQTHNTRRSVLTTRSCLFKVINPWYKKELSHPLLLANLYTGTWRRGGGGIRRSHFVAMAHLKAELWLVRWCQNKHGGRNESDKAFENKCYLLYEIKKFRINNSRVRKVIHG